VVVEWTGAIANKDDTFRLRVKDGLKKAEVRSTIPSRAVIRRAMPNAVPRAEEA
jgi:hypothetical protein